MARYQKYRLKWPLTPSQLINIDEMFAELFTDNQVLNDTLQPIGGGTGLVTYVTGDLLYASSATALARLGIVASGSVLVSGAIPAWSPSPTLTTSLTVPRIVGGTIPTQQLAFVSTSGVGTTDKIVFLTGTNGSTLVATYDHAGNAQFSGDLQGQTFTTTGRIWSTSWIRAGGSDSTAPIAGDLVTNRGGVPGSGVVFFGGSANLHYLYYDGSIFNLTDKISVTGDIQGSANLILTGKATKYANVTTAGWGHPAIYGSGRSASQTAAVASVAAYTVGAADGSFLVSANVLVTTSTLHSFTATCGYTDEGGTSRTLTLSFSQLAGTFVTAITNATGAGPYEGIPLHIRAKAGTSITIATTGTFTTVTYNVEGLISQVS